MKTIFLIIFLILLNSCGIHKNKYEIMNLVTNLKNISPKCDSLNLLKLSSKIETCFLEVYLKEKNEFQNGQINTNHIFNWLNNNNKWVFTEEDILWFKKEIEKSNSIPLNSKLIKSRYTKIIFKDNPTFKDELQKNIEITKRIINCNYLCQLSTPVFNKNKSIAIVMKKEILLNEFVYYIFKKYNKKWELICYTQTNSE